MKIIYYQIIFILIINCCWSMTIWGGWAESLYEKNKQENSYLWFWLRTFKIPVTKENCIRSLKAFSLVGMGLATIGGGVQIYLEFM